MAKNNIEEEVTITPIIKDLERIFNRVIRFIGAFFISLYKAFVSLFWFCYKNFILLLVFLLFGITVGYFSSELITPKYSSELILDLNIESTSQLTADVDYISALIENNQNEALALLFGITSDEANSLEKIDIKGSSTYVQKIKNINSFYEKIDTSLLRKINFESIFTTDLNDFDERYTITIESTNERVFSKLEPKLLAFFERVPELQKLRKNTKTNLVYQKQIYLDEMKRIDTLKKVMNEVMIEQSKSKSSGSVTNISFDQAEQKKDLEILEIYNRYLFYSKELILLDEKINDLDYIYNVNAHFSSFGEKSSYNRIEFMLASALSFFILGILFIVLKGARKNDSTSNV